MSRILFWVLIAVVIYLAIVLARKKRSREVSAEKCTKRKDAPVVMVECRQCGTHFPEDEAVLGDGKAYCSEKCRKNARKAC